MQMNTISMTKDKKQENFSANTKLGKNLMISRDFNWIENEFIEPKNIKVYEVSGNIAQTKVLPEILSEMTQKILIINNTAVVLLDENLLPATFRFLHR